MKHSVEIRRREPKKDANLPADLHPLLRRLYLQRGIKEPAELDRSVKNLLSWKILVGIEAAVLLLHHMLQEKNQIIVVGDFDADGATSTALTVLALRRMGGNIDYIVPNRFEDGYGLSPRIVEYARIRGAKMILTVDNGISAYAGIDISNKYGIPVLVTDHHIPGKILPVAEVIINPNLNASAFSLRSLAGVGVVFYLMVALRAHLRHKNWFQNGITEPNLAEFLDLVALGTVADLVPLDTNNRILVWQGLKRIRAGKCREGIRTLLKIANSDIYQVTASDLSFIIGPRLNAAGRLDDMSIGVALLLTDDIVQAGILSKKLDMLNQERKKIERAMQQEAFVLYNMLKHQYSTSDVPLGLSFYHPKWHQGVVGVLASRLKEHFNRPVIAFASVGDGILKGSGRSIIGLHLCNALEHLHALFPGLIIKFGGHAMAVGLSLKEKKYEEFCQCFSALMNKWLKNKSLNPVIWSDGELCNEDFSLRTAKMLKEAGPWGQSFPEPVFDGHFKLLKQWLVGGCHLKVLLKPIGGGPLLNGIAFNIDTTLWPDSNIEQVEIAYKLDINGYHSNNSVQLIVDYIWPKQL